MGSDGKVGSMVGEDVYGVVLGYYDNDYSPVKATTQPFELAYAGSLFAGASNGFYNGNIRNATVALRSHLYYDDTDVSMSPIGYAYTYDQLNRYVKMRVYNNYDTATNEWQSGGAALQDYAENVLYDGNGNILAYIRHGNPTIGVTTGPTAMDSMAYVYNTSNNQLNRVADGVSSSNYSIDIDNEVSNNYLYDKNGEMTFDSSQHLTIAWNVRNKVATIYNDISKLLITFGYDAMGNRVMKRDSNLSTHKCYTLWYERDAQGNVLSMYKERHDSMWWQESDIYGSGRIGVYYPDSLIYPKGTQVSANDTFTMELWEGKRQYELVNHLGNVLTTISDKKILLASNATNNSGTRNAYRNITSYQPEVVSISDYYPFGMLEPGRNYALADDTSFRYGFNNKENDNDIEGKGDWQDYGTRPYMPLVGKFPTVDLVAKKYPWLSTYQFAADRPTKSVDIDGKETDEDLDYDPDEEVKDDLNKLKDNRVQLITDPKILEEAEREIDKTLKSQPKIIPGTQNLMFEYGGPLYEKEGEVLTVLGRYNGNSNMNYAGTKDLKNNPNVNILDEPRAPGESREGFFDRVNKPFLDEDINQGKSFRLISDPENKENLFLHKTDENGNSIGEVDYSKPTFYKMELDYLKSRGYIIQGGYASPALSKTGFQNLQGKPLDQGNLNNPQVINPPNK